MKISEVREMSVADLRDRIAVEKANLDTMKMNHAISPLEDTSKFKKSRKDIARMLTVLTEKEKEQTRHHEAQPRHLSIGEHIGIQESQKGYRSHAHYPR